MNAKTPAPNIATRLRNIRNRTGMGMDKFAKHIGLPGGSSLQRYEDASVERTHLPVDLVQKLLKVVGSGDPPIQRREIMAMAVPVVEEIFPQAGFFAEDPPFFDAAARATASTVPIYAAAMGGEGHIIVHFEEIQRVSPPPEISTVRGGYGILVVGESMVPAFEAGDVAWINPHLPPQADTFVVLYHTPPHGSAEAIIKRLVSFTPERWRIRQYNEPKEWNVPFAEWPHCHRVVGKKMR
jgi:hypothetical protein